METLTSLKSFVEDPDFQQKRNHTLNKIDYNLVDKPITKLIKNINNIDICFTIQCCYGHFVYEDQKDNHNLEPLPHKTISGEIEYRIAYLALCIENSTKGRFLYQALKKIPVIDKKYIQFGCAEWFWERQINSFVLQVEPDRYKNQDVCFVDYEEALHLENVRNNFFIEIRKLISVL